MAMDHLRCWRRHRRRRRDVRGTVGRGPVGDGVAGFEEGGNEPVSAGEAGAVTGVDRVESGAGDGPGQLLLVAGRHDMVPFGHDHSGRHVDRMHPGPRVERSDGLTGQRDGVEARPPHLIPRPWAKTMPMNGPQEHLGDDFASRSEDRREEAHARRERQQAEEAGPFEHRAGASRGRAQDEAADQRPMLAPHGLGHQPPEGVADNDGTFLALRASSGTSVSQSGGGLAVSLLGVEELGGGPHAVEELGREDDG